MLKWDAAQSSYYLGVLGMHPRIANIDLSWQEIAQQVKVATTKANLNLSSQTHMVEGENNSLNVSSDLLMHTSGIYTLSLPQQISKCNLKLT